MNEDFQDKSGHHFGRNGEGRKPREGYGSFREGRAFPNNGRPYSRRTPHYDGMYGATSNGDGPGRQQFRRYPAGASDADDRLRRNAANPRPFHAKDYGYRQERRDFQNSPFEQHTGDGNHWRKPYNGTGDEGRTGYARSGNGTRQFSNRRPVSGRETDNAGTSQRYAGHAGNAGYGPRRPFKPYTKYSNKKRLIYKEKNYDPNEPIRLNKYLANAGICSRRDADKYIAAGVVTVNGNVVTELGAKVLRSDSVMFHDTPVKIEKKVYVLLNKPKGYVTTSEDPQNRRIVMDLVKDACSERIYPVGRLDRNTTGVLLLTNDGELASKLTHPKYLKKKIYHVHTDRNVSAADLQQIVSGITLEDGEVRADAAAYASDVDKKQVGIEIHSGKNRIVRRIFEHLGYRVLKLDRVYFAGLTKKGLCRGDWRFLTEKEVSMLQMGAFE